jgi:methylase of polypeptide subunit release factors
VRAFAKANGRQLPPPRLLDIGCGSGAISIALLKSIPGATATAIDVDPAAVQLTTENADRWVQVLFSLSHSLSKGHSLSFPSVFVSVCRA